MQDFQFFIVDDHKMLSSGLSSFLTAKFPESNCLATFENAADCLAFIGSVPNKTGGYK